MSKAIEKDMTKGSPFGLILSFTVPVIIGNVFQQLYNMVDAVIVGRFVGVNALAAVGMSGSIIFCILGFLNGVSAGFTVLTAKSFGAGQIDKMKRSVYSACILCLCMTALLTVLSTSCLRGLLHLINTPEDIFREAYTYLFITFLGIWTQVLYNLMASLLRAIGNSKVPLYFLLFAVGLNVVLDLLFIIGFHMGTPGAAIATVLSQGTAGILCLIYILRQVPLLHVDKKNRVLEKEAVKFQIRIGLPMGLQFSITASGMIILQGALNNFGSKAVAGFTSAMKVMQVINQVMISMGTTMATYASQNMGAHRLDRIRKGQRAAIGMMTAYSVFIGLVLFFFGKYIVRIFIAGGQADVLIYPEQYFSIASPFMLVLASIFIYRNILQGMGFGFIPMMAGVAELGARSLAAYIASHYVSFTGICLADPFAWVAAAVPLFLTYLWTMKKLEGDFSHERKK